MSDNLFEEFPDISSKQWKQRIQVDLKGADYNEALVWSTSEGMDVKPFYHPDQFDGFSKIPASESKGWNICQDIFVADIKKSNAHAIDALQRGAEVIAFTLPSQYIQLEALLTAIDSDVQIVLDCQFLSSEFIQKNRKYFETNRIFLNSDIIGNLAKSGNWFSNLNDDHQQFVNIVKTTDQFSVDMGLYQNAGANMIQQLAYGMSHANEYLNHLDSQLSEQSKDKLVVNFKVSVGSNYFFEIAKLRALRLLWSSLAKEYSVNAHCRITMTPSKRNKTLYDYNTNMLRTTTECMSAILGGADTICNLSYDAIYHKTNEFGERIALNQLLVLKHESYFDKVENPSDGTYYIETLTEQLAEKSLELFKDIERQGGFLKQLKAGTIQRKIKESAQNEQQAFDNGELILLGSNKHPNTQDRMKQELELYPFVKKNPVKTLIEPIIEKRLAEALEQERLKSEN